MRSIGDVVGSAKHVEDRRVCEILGFRRAPDEVTSESVRVLSILRDEVRYVFLTW
jgi:hypothetical protein